MGNTVKRVGRGFEKFGGGALNALTFGLFEGKEPPAIPAPPEKIDPNTDLPGEVSVEDRRRLERQKRKQRQMQGRQGTILGDVDDTANTSIAQSATLLGS